VPLRFVVDTGAETTLVDRKVAPKLGIDLNKGLLQEVVGFEGEAKGKSYLHQLVFRIGNLKPIVADMVFSESPALIRKTNPSGLLGWKNALSRYSLTFTSNTVTFTELQDTISVRRLNVVYIDRG